MKITGKTFICFDRPTDCWFGDLFDVLSIEQREDFLLEAETSGNAAGGMIDVDGTKILFMAAAADNGDGYEVDARGFIRETVDSESGILALVPVSFVEGRTMRTGLFLPDVRGEVVIDPDTGLWSGELQCDTSVSPAPAMAA
jgi:hypothetical protein